MSHVAWVNYDELGHDDMTYTLKQFVKNDGELKAGDAVNTYDSFGQVCQGVIVRLEEEIVHIRLDESTKKKANTGDYVGN